MDSKRYIKNLLKDLSLNKTTPARAFDALKNLPYKDLKFARLDHHRLLRKGFGEVVYCAGKTPAHVKEILGDIIEKKGQVFLTRADKSLYEYLRKTYSFLKYNELARIIYTKKQRPKNNKTVLILTAGTSDIPVAEEARLTLQLMGNRVKAIYDVGVAGIHRLFDKMNDISKANVIIVVAGMEGALASVVAGLTEKPVIAVPTSVGYGSSFKGIAPLLTMMNCCSPGVVVVNIDNGFGAGYFASLINK